MTLYLDASAFTKLFLAEEGSIRAAEFWSLDISVVSSAITYAETAAALGGARRARRLSVKAMTSAVSSLDARWGHVTSIDVDDRVSRAAASLSVRHGLRGMDAIHLASALLFAAAEPVVVTWDARLRRAATAEGLAVSA